jgi:hypothetical protein
MTVEVITDRPDLLIRRQSLAAGAATAWHTDTCHRFSVVVRGTRLRIEFRDGGDPVEMAATAGLACWDAPEPRVHRAVNVGPTPFEEIVTYYRRPPGCDVQPEPTGG